MQGQYYDPEFDLCYNRNRYYDPGTGSFVSADPLGLDAGTNNYAYAPNVWGWIDPLGLMECETGDSKKIVRRFDTKKNIKQARKKGIEYDSNKGTGISAASDNIDPVDPNSIRDITGMSREPEAYIDIDITNKNVIEKTTKSGHIEYQIQDDISPSDIVHHGKVKKSRY